MHIKTYKIITSLRLIALCGASVFIMAFILLPTNASAITTLPPPTIAAAQSSGGDVCGEGSGGVKTSINIGCAGKGSPLLDALFAIIRFLSNGAGLVLIGSLVYGGIQYSASKGDPQASAAAQNRIKSVFFALILFIFSYAILNYLVPGELLK